MTESDLKECGYQKIKENIFVKKYEPSGFEVSLVFNEDEDGLTYEEIEDSIMKILARRDI